MKQEQSEIVLPVTVETPLKEMIVNYIGEKTDPPDGNVTVEMAVEIFAAEFPEFLMLIAEENFLRGYKQALDDVDSIEPSE